ncbi:MAG TPA: hypothetical protein PLI43_01355 [Albidovulum sp.]|uniref:hypothetical protein n=1 Tax=Albidovulum sp. TaxID=1872424 RepID=UPI002C0B5C20|nr:hypothetical protein [Albidovulum sp.]
MLALAPQLLEASVGCVAREQNPDTLEIVAMPGEDGYAPAAYAALLYAHLRRCLAEDDCIVLLGELTPKWPATRPLPHIQAEERQIQDYRSSDSFRGYGVHFDYSDFYEFKGVQLTAKGPVGLRPDQVDGSAGAAEEGYWSYPMETNGPQVFTALFFKEEKYNFLRLSVPGAYFCGTFPMPAPDTEAIGHLTACIANGGCGASQ